MSTELDSRVHQTPEDRTCLFLVPRSRLSCPRARQKCDGARPVCGQCVRIPRGEVCEYTDSPSRTRLLQDTLVRLQSRVQELEEPFPSALALSPEVPQTITYSDSDGGSQRASGSSGYLFSSLDMSSHRCQTRPVALVGALFLLPPHFLLFWYAALLESPILVSLNAFADIGPSRARCCQLRDTASHFPNAVSAIRLLPEHSTVPVFSLLQPAAMFFAAEQRLSLGCKPLTDVGPRGFFPPRSVG